jgi:hypothetical protein
MEQVGTSEPGVAEQIVMIEDPPPEVAPEATTEDAVAAAADAGIGPPEPDQIEVPEEAETEAEAPAPGLGPSPWVTRGRVALLANANRQIARGRTLSRSMESALKRYVRSNRGDPRPHLLLGANYYLRRSYRGAVQRYELAQRVSSDARNDPRMLRHLVRMAAESSAATLAANTTAQIYGALAKAQIVREIERQAGDEAAIARLDRLDRRLR